MKSEKRMKYMNINEIAASWDRAEVLAMHDLVAIRLQSPKPMESMKFHEILGNRKKSMTFNEIAATWVRAKAAAKVS